MKWHKKLSVVSVCLSILYLFGLFGTNNAYAAATIPQITYGIVYRKLNNNAWGSATFASSATNIPLTIVAYDSSYMVTYLATSVNMSANIPTNLRGSGKYITTTVTGTMSGAQSNNCNGITGSIRPEGVTVDEAQDTISCSVSEKTLSFSITSNITMPTDAAPTSFVVAMANNTNYLYSCSNQAQAMTQLCMTENNWKLNLLKLDWTITKDPNTALLQQQVDQNQQMIDQDNQDRDNVQNTSDNAQQSGNNAGQAATQKGQTLMQAFSSLITAVTNIHATDCNLPNFAIYGLQFQNMNMCLFEMPSAIMTLASIGMVFIIVPLGINLVKRMIALYNEIIGGK